MLQYDDEKEQHACKSFSFELYWNSAILKKEVESYQDDTSATFEHLLNFLITLRMKEMMMINDDEIYYGDDYTWCICIYKG